MMRSIIDPLAKLVMLISGTILSFQFSKQWFVALLYGIICHVIFIAAVLVMLLAMFFGMSKSYGNVPHPFSYLSNFLFKCDCTVGYKNPETSPPRTAISLTIVPDIN